MNNHLDSAEQSPRAVSLFCGAGGCSLGFKNAGYEVMYACDIDEHSIRTYQKNFSDTVAEVQDLRCLDFAKLRDQLSLQQGELEILIGGPPCQGFSTAGSRFWEDPRNELLRKYVEALREFRPKWFLMENVEGLLTAKGGKYLQEAVKALVDSGYSLRVEKVYSHEFGVPQRRKRVFVVGSSIVSDFAYPFGDHALKGRIFRDGEVTLGDAIDGLPPPSTVRYHEINYTTEPHSELENEMRSQTGSVTDHISNSVSHLQEKRFGALKPGQTMKDLPPELQHGSFQRRANRRVADGTATEKRGGSPAGIKRLHRCEPSLTITSAATREFVHYEANRTLTVRECARLQTFPDSFEFTGPSSEKVRQIGNAIPPKLAFVFAAHILTRYGFDGKPIKEGRLAGYMLTKSAGMSPALKKTEGILEQLARPNAYRQMSLPELSHVD